MALPTLDDLLKIPTQDEVLDQEVFPELRTRGARVTDWIVGGVYRTMAYVVALLRLDVRKSIAAFAAAGFEDYVFGLAAAPAGIDVTAWAALVAKQRYGVDRIAATYTNRTIRLTNSTGTPYGPVSAGGIILQFTATGNRYILDGTVTIPASSFVDATFRSEFVVDSAAGRTYNDSASATIVLVTANYPGVTATNPAPTYSSVSQAGAGTGTVTPSGSPSGNHSVAVRIDASGQVTAATWSTSLDGAAWVSQGAAGSVTNLGGFGINITLANGASGNPSFIAGTYYYFSTPGSDVTQVGRDQETPTELGARVRGLWPSLAFVKDSAGNWIWTSPTVNAYETLAKSASDQVKIAFAKTDATVNNKVKIYIAAQGDLVPSGVLSTVSAFFNSRSMLTDLPEVLSPTKRTITLAAVTVTVKQGQLATAQGALQTALKNYLGGVDPKVVLGINGRVDRAYILSLIRNTTGVVKVSDVTLTINGVAADLQLPVTAGAFELAVWTQAVASDFTWVTEA